MIPEPIRLAQRYRPTRHARLLAAVAALVLAVLAVFLVGMEWSPTDAFIYLLAGQRLNAGHYVYSLVAGDYPVGLNPPYWTAPLLSPPLIAVLWRPLAALGSAGLIIGWLATGAAFLAAVTILVWRNPVVAGAAVVALTVPIGWQLGLGNLNGLLLLGLVAIWSLRQRPAVSGAVLAGLVALKVVPIVLLWWLVTQRAWRAVGAFAVASAVLIVLVMLGAGPLSLLDYAAVAGHTATEGTNALSLAGLARSAGVDPSLSALIPWCVVLIGAALIWHLRARPGVSFSVAVVIVVFGSPVVNIYWYALLLAALAPYPADNSAGEEGELEEGPTEQHAEPPPPRSASPTPAFGVTLHATDAHPTKPSPSGVCFAPSNEASPER